MKRVIIMGAAGRDFHNFNVAYRNSPDTRVVAFTATQIPGIEGRTYPPELAGPHYPQGIPIYSEDDLPRLVKELKADIAVLSYSDISYLDVMHKASIAMAAGADFELLGPHSTTLKSKRPVVSVCAVRTGAGKSTVSRRIASILKSHSKKVAIIRHPMPYGNLLKEASQRFATLEDLDRADCSIEEREEYEPHIANGFVVFAGVDYQKILEAAEKEADVILWDGGNNDIPFIQPDVHLVVLDPLRPGNELDHYPSEINVRLANAGIINKVDTAEPENVQMVETNLKKLAPNAIAIEAVTEITLDKPELVQGKRVLVIEDGPTVTHGDMTFGVGLVAAKRFHASEIVDPRKSAVGIYKDTFRKYYRLTQVLPTMGYGQQQVRDLQDTIARTDCDSVIIATPADLRRLIKFPKPTAMVSYELKEKTKPGIQEVLKKYKII